MKKTLIFMALVIIANQIIAQDYKFGKVSKEELEEKYYPLDSSANASVLYKNRRTHFEYVQDEGFNVITEIHERIKIYNKEGFEWATKNIVYYNASNAKEKISNLKAVTYFIENNKIVETDLSKKEVFDEQSNKYWSQQKFTMPNIKEGCVLEWTYKIISPIKRIEDLQFQYEIPVKKIDAKIEIPEYFVYKKRYKGYYPLAAKEEQKNSQIVLTNKSREEVSRSSIGSGIKTNFSQSKINYTTKIESYEIENVPALIEEAYVSNIDNYKTAVQYEYSELHWPREPIKFYSNTWDDVAKTIYNDYDFKTELNQSSQYSDDLSLVLASSASSSEKITGIFELVKNKIKWNKYNGITKFNGTKKAYKEGVGNVFDINLNLVSMLNKAGFKANPVILSTRSNGIPFFPTIDGFNYVIAAIELENNVILLDATEEYSTPNNLPLRVLNWQGRIIREDGTSSAIDLVASEPAKIYNTVSINIDNEGVVKGLNRSVYSNNQALNYRNSYAVIKDADIVLKLEAENENIEISEFQLSDKNDSYKPIMETYKFSSENSLDMVGNKIYFKPLFFTAITKSPFNLEKRDYPIDFGTPLFYKNIISISIPDGYSVESLPENMIVKLPDNYGAYKLMISTMGNMINVLAQFEINSAIYPADRYSEMKEFYKLIVNKNLEQVVLKKG